MYKLEHIYYINRKIAYSVRSATKKFKIVEVKLTLFKRITGTYLHLIRTQFNFVD